MKNRKLRLGILCSILLSYGDFVYFQRVIRSEPVFFILLASV
jgi:hypothetical protein